MNVETFQSLFEYHFEFNRRLWEYCVEHLTDEQRAHEFEYSHGSIHNVFIHIMSVDDRWLSGLMEVDLPDFLDPFDFKTPQSIREKWDETESRMKEILVNLDNSNLSELFTEGLRKWEVLFHLVNHGTHHRAHIFAMLNRMNIKSYPQDYALFRLGRI